MADNWAFSCISDLGDWINLCKIMKLSVVEALKIDQILVTQRFFGETRCIFGVYA
jgi:hypothetical protein